MFTADSGVSSPSRMCGTRFRHIQELPAEDEITSNSVRGSAPARMPSASASAAVAMCTPARSWFTIFTVLPIPARSPRRHTFSAIASSTGPARSKAASLPDPMTVMVPALARAAPPDTGASSSSNPRSASLASRAVA